ncbi:MAG TPA: FtsX-like permease family protein [Thermoanaerobaculia bacterium]|nr:FtsX-like permease family protein [Thermoanaerobaculia bacterium]
MSGLRSLFVALVLRPLSREKGRSLITIGGIAVGVAVLVAIQLSNQSALHSFEASVNAISGRANYQIVSDAGMIDESLLLHLSELWDSGGRFAPVIDMEGTLDPDDTPIRLLAVDLVSDLHFRDYRYARILTSGDVRKSGSTSSPADIIHLGQLFRPDSIILPVSFARQHRLDLGSRLQMTMNGQPASFVVRGLLESRGPATAFNGSLAIADIATAQAAFHLQGKLTRIDLLIPDASMPRILARLHSMVPANARLEHPSRRNERVEKMLAAFRVNLLALAGVALLVGVFLVYNTVLISILRRRRDVGILKTLGASAPQIFFVFITEGLFLGLIGSALGVIVGYCLAFGTLDLISRTINALYVTSSPTTLQLTPRLIAVAIGLGTIVSVAASIQPAAEAAGVRPALLIRPGLYQRMRRSRSRNLAVIAVGFLVLSAALSQIPVIEGFSVGGYAAVMSVVAAFSLFAPLAVTAVSAGLRPILRKCFATVGDLAAVSLPASLRRVAVATAALSIAIGMMVAVAVMIGSFRETVNAWVAQTVKSDLWLRPAKGLSNSPVAVFPDSISSDLDRIPFIDAYDRFRGRDVAYGDSIIAVGSGDFAVAITHGDLPMVTPHSAKRALEQGMRENGVLISESMALKFHKGPGDVVELPTADGLTRFPITGVYRDYSNDRGVVVMNRALYVKKYRDNSINTVAVFLKKGVDPERARGLLERDLGSRFHLFAFTNRNIRTEVMKIFDQTFMITYALLLVALVVAVLGIVNTMSALILERRHEIALLKVLGVSRGEISLMVVLESAIIAVTSTVLGCLSGYVLALILIFVINKQSFGWTIQFQSPALLVITSLISTFAATCLAGLIPTRLANRVVISSELKSE